MASHHMHNGPLAGQWIPVEYMNPHALNEAVWRLRMGRFQGRYIRDETSAGGRDWDWEEDD